MGVLSSRYRHSSYFRAKHTHINETLDTYFYKPFKGWEGKGAHAIGLQNI